MDIDKNVDLTKLIFQEVDEILPYSYKNVGELVKNGYFYSFATYDIKTIIFLLFL